MNQKELPRGWRWLWLAGTLVGCGGLNEGTVLIVDDVNGHSGGGGESGGPSDGGDSGTGGSSSPIGGVGGSPEGGTSDGGEPPVTDEPPTVVSVSPEDSEEGVEPRVRVVIEFSESVDEGSLEGAITVTDGEEQVEATVELNGALATLTFPRRLDLLTTYTVEVSTAVTDLAGNALPADFSSTFTVRDGEWGNFVVLNNPPDMGRVSSDAFPAPVFDGEGNALAVWSQQSNVNGPQSVWGRVYSPLRGWQASVKLSAAGEDCTIPSVAMNQRGDALVAWRQADGSFVRVFARRYLSGSWESTPLRVDIANVNVVSELATAMTEEGEAHVLWRYTSGSYRYLAANTAPESGAWRSDDLYISGQFSSLSGPAVAFNAAGVGFAVWAGTVGSTSVVRAARYLANDGWGNVEDAPGSSSAIVGTYSSPSIAVSEQGDAMSVWSTQKDVVASHFTKVGGWSDPATVDGATSGQVSQWSPRIAAHGSSFVAHWHQSVGSVTSAFANTFSGTTWAAQPILLSDGDSSVYDWSETGFGLDRHGNGVATWVQGSDVKFARLVGVDGSWTEAAVIQKLLGTPTEARSGVATNGMAAVIASNGYPYYERHDDLFAGIFQ
jgi:Bacterial Ig-like domain